MECDHGKSVKYNFKVAYIVYYKTARDRGNSTMGMKQSRYIMSELKHLDIMNS